MKKSYSHASELLNKARKSLMLPHPKGELHDITTAMSECRLAFADLGEIEIVGVETESISRCVETLKEFMNLEGLEDPTGIGLHYVLAEKLTLDEKITFTDLVNELASLLDMQVLGQ